MQGRIVVGLGTLAVPAVLIGVTVYRFGSNPLSLVALVAIMLVGGIYQLSYTESF